MPSPLPPDDLPPVTLSIPEIAKAKKDGFLRIHDKGTLTIQRPGGPLVQVFAAHTPLRRPKLRKKLTCADLCDKTWESQGCPTGTCALYAKNYCV